MRRVLLTALAIFGLLAASAEAQQTGTQGIHSWPSPTIPLPVGSCMYVQQPIGGGTYTDTALCPSTLAGWATAFGITATLPTLAGATANTAHVLGNGTAAAGQAADTIFTAGSGVTITCATGTCTIGASGTGGVSGPGTSVIGNLVGWASATGDALNDSGIAASNVATKSGTNTFAGANTFASTVTLSGITGSTQCLQVNTSGVVSGTGAACGGGGGGTLTVNGTTGTVTGVTGLTITGAAGTTVAVTGTTPNATATITAAGGGGGLTVGTTAIASGTTYGVLFNNTGNVLGNTAVGTAGQVLTSNGAGVAPTFQNPAAGGGNMTGSGATTTGNVLLSGNTGATLDSATDGGIPGTNLVTTTNTKTLTNKTYSGGTFDTANTWTVTAGTPTVYLGIDASSHLVSGTPAGSGTVGNCSTADALAYYASTGTTVGCLSGVGTTGQVLTSNGAGVAPSFQNATGGGNVSTAGTLTANTLIIGAGTTNINNEADWSVVSHELIGNLSGSAAPTAPGSTDGIQIVAASGRAGVVTADSFANGSGFIGRRANGTPASPTTVLAGQAVAAMQGGGYDGTAYFTTGGEIAIASDENWSNTAHGSRIDIYRTGNTTTTLVKSASFDSQGGLQMANSSGTLPGSPGAGGIAVPTTAGYFIGTVQAGSQIAGTSVVLSANQWAACVGTTVTAASQTFTLPAASGLSTNGCFDIQAQAATTLALAGGTDTINGGSAGVSLSIPAGTTVHVTLTGTNFTAPLGSATAGVASVNTSTPGVTIGGTGSGPWTGAVTVDLTAASNTQSGNSAYTIVTGDKNKTVYRTNTTTETDILPPTGTTGFGVGYGMDYCVDGTGNTISVSTSTINGQASLFVPPYTCLAIQATATNVYLAARSSPRVAPLADITATGNVDMAQACFIPLNYNSASAGTLTFPDVAGFAGCVTSISESSTGQATVAAAGSATVVANTTACTTNKRTAGQYATITVQVLGDSGGHPIYKVAGECG